MRVDINHATVAELEKVPGLTHSWAGRIVRFRPYRTKQDLMEKGVVNSEVYDRIKDFVIALVPRLACPASATGSKSHRAPG